MREAFIIGTAMMRFGKLAERDIKSLTAEAVTAVLADAGVDSKQLEAVWFANSSWGANGGQDCIRGQVALRPLGIDAVPIVNVDNACAGGSTALHGSWLSVAGGAHELVMAVGVEKLFSHRRLKMFAQFIGGLDVGELPALLAEAQRLRAELPALPPAKPTAGGRSRSSSPLSRLRAIPSSLRDLFVIAERYAIDVPELVRLALHGKIAVPGGGRSPFMDVYALSARQHMARYGSTQRQLAAVAAKNHTHGALNPLAQVQIPMTTEQVLADRAVAFPLTRSMCAPIGDGACAALICSAAMRRRLDRCRAIRIRASVLVSGGSQGNGQRSIAARAGAASYEKAGLGPTDIDLAKLHDATAFGELKQSEELGFCEEGMGGELAESGAT